MLRPFLYFALLICSLQSCAGPIDHHEQDLSISVSSTSPLALTVHHQEQEVYNSAVLAGNTNTSAAPVSGLRNGKLEHNAGKVSYSIISSQVARVSVDTSFNFVGARFTTPKSANFYGVWEYSWSDQLTDNGVKFEIKGAGDSRGGNWANARAPFYFSNARCGVYADTLDMGPFDFTQSGTAESIFTTSSLVYYIG